MREKIMHEYGIADGERKIQNFVDLDKAPWSIVTPHIDVVRDVRQAFIAGSYYSALLGAAGLGERILNDLVLRLPDSFSENPETLRVSKKQSLNDWGVMINALHGWGVIDMETALECRRFSRLRHDVVHYRSDKDIYARDSALLAMQYLTRLIHHVFSPMGGPPRFISGTSGHSFLMLAAESDPVVRDYFLPNCVLVSPHFEFTDVTTGTVLDERDYNSIHGVLNLADDEFAERYNSTG